MRCIKYLRMKYLAILSMGLLIEFNAFSAEFFDKSFNSRGRAFSFRIEDDGEKSENQMNILTTMFKPQANQTLRPSGKHLFLRPPFFGKSGQEMIEIDAP